MANHYLFIDNVSERQEAEHLRKGLVHSNIFVFGLDFAFKPIDVVDLLGLMVSTSHMQEIFISNLPGYQGEHALNRKRTSVNEIPIEEVFVFDCWVSIDFEDVEQIVVLAMNIAAYRNLFFVFDWIVD